MAGLLLRRLLSVARLLLCGLLSVAGLLRGLLSVAGLLCGLLSIPWLLPVAGRLLGRWLLLFLLAAQEKRRDDDGENESQRCLVHGISSRG